MKIREAAVRKNGKMYTGRNHSEIFKNNQSDGYIGDGEQGFVTDTGEFVNRIEGLKIAQENDQIIEKHPMYSELYSEDIYDIVNIDDLHKQECKKCGKILNFVPESIRSSRELAYCCDVEYSTEPCSVYIRKQKSPYVIKSTPPLSNDKTESTSCNSDLSNRNSCW